jgi:predicted dehydrogenase
MNIAIIGHGYWGPNLVRNFWNTKNCNVLYVTDLKQKNLKSLKRIYPDVVTDKSFEEILQIPSVDAVVIATPASTHYSLSRKVLEHNKHVLIEKPMTTSVKNAQKLIELSKKKKKVLMVDHTYLYTGAIQKIKQIIDKNTIGEIQYIDSTRINLGLFQSDVNVLWDLAVHDVSICSYLLNKKPISVQAIGQTHTKTKLEDIAYLTLHFKSNKIAHFNCSWISPVKIRHMLIGGNKKMIVFNDLESTEKIKVYDTSFREKKNSGNGNNILADYRVGDIYVPKISTREGLSVMAEDFMNAVTRNKEPISNKNLSLDVVRILEAAEQSIKNNGKEVIL